MKTQVKNNYFNADFVTYFMNYCVPIWPLWSNTLVRQTTVTLKPEEKLSLTNATAESTFSYEKQYVFKKNTRVKIGEFVKTYADYLTAKLKQFDFAWKHKGT